MSGARRRESSETEGMSEVKIEFAAAVPALNKILAAGTERRCHTTTKSVKWKEPSISFGALVRNDVFAMISRLKRANVPVQT